jgi:hypothetical protein
VKAPRNYIESTLIDTKSNMTESKSQEAADFGAKMTEILQKMEQLNHRLVLTERENVCLKKEIDDTREYINQDPNGSMHDRADRAYRDDVARTRTFVSKLTAFNPDREDIRMFMRRFDAYCESNRIEEPIAISELIQHAGSSIANIVLMRDQDQWTLNELRSQILDRLAPRWDVNRIEQELYKI